MSGKCGGCKHWDRDGIRNDWRFSIRLDNAPGETQKQADERSMEAEALFGKCNAIPLLDSYEKIDTIPLAFTQDASDYRADLFTQATFGCVLWESA